MYYIQPDLINNHEYWKTRDNKNAIVFDIHTAQWKVGQLKEHNSVTNGLASMCGLELWPHWIINDWKYMNDSFVWTDTNSKNRIIVNEQIEVKLLDNLEEKKTKIEAKIQYLFLSFADSEDGYRCEYYCHWKSWSWKEYNLELHCWRGLVQGNH